MSFEATKEKMRELMKYKKEIQKYHSMKSFDKVKGSVDHMMETLECMNAGNSVAGSERDRKMVFRGTNMILDTVRDKKMTDWYRDFSLAYCKLLVNYDNNAVQDERFRRKAKVIKRLVNSNYALRDLLVMAKKMKNEDRNRQATRLARHYLNSLEEEECG